MWRPQALFIRDTGPLSFDVATHSDAAEIGEYGGLLHWFRDTLEKCMTILLILVFCLFLGRAAEYAIDFLRGDPCVQDAMQYDMVMAGRMIGLALIVDGVLLVAAMTDAPGIGRTLDSLIVILTGIVITITAMWVHHVVGGAPSSTVDWGAVQRSSPFFLVAIAGLFVVRWMIRHHTLGAWLARDERK
jgi:hypothetical protein